MIVATITLDNNKIQIIDTRSFGCQKAWLRDLKYRWGDRVSHVEFTKCPRGWYRTATNKEVKNG